MTTALTKPFHMEELQPMILTTLRKFRHTIISTIDVHVRIGRVGQFPDMNLDN